MDDAKRTQAVIYCRTASLRHSESGSLELQEKSCRRFAKVKGYEIAKVFKDKGASGRSSRRLEIDELLAFLSSNSEDEFVVLVDDLRRLASELVTYFNLRREIENLGAKLECPNFEFEDSPTTRLMEKMIILSADMEKRLIEEEKASNARS